MFQARMNAAVCARAVRRTSQVQAGSDTAEAVGRMMSGAETANWILRLVQGRGLADMTGRFPAMAHHADLRSRISATKAALMGAR
jgi:hypothetical protein